MTEINKLFLERDQRVIESTPFEPHSKPIFNALRSHLFWADEVPRGITVDALETIGDLQIARAHLHHGLKLHHLLDPDVFIRVWNQALSENIKWNGFQRLELSFDDKAYYEQCLAKDTTFE